MNFEIPDEVIENHIKSYIKNSLTGSSYSYSLSKIIEECVKETIIREFQNSSFSKVIEDKCQEIALKEIELAAKKKVPGWINNQMKEMLKYARARFWEDKNN